MTDRADTVRNHFHQTLHWLRLLAGPFDILAALSEALGAAWVVQRETDCEGEVSILAMAAGDEDKAYEEDGLTQVATVQNDAWQILPGFANAQEAVAAVVTLVARLAATQPATIGLLPNLHMD